jgi:hypothetical protein
MRSIIPLFAFALAASAPALAVENVPVPPFNNVELRGGGDVMLVPGPTQRITLLQGSTAFTRFHVDGTGKLRIDACNERCPQHYDLRIEIQSPHVPGVGVRGGGSIHAKSGFAAQERVAAGVSGGGKIDLGAVEARTAAAGIDGGGFILVRPTSTLAAGVNGGGEVRYFGHPQVTSAINGGGNVRPVN